MASIFKQKKKAIESYNKTSEAKRNLKATAKESSAVIIPARVSKPTKAAPVYTKKIVEPVPVIGPIVRKENTPGNNMNF